MSRFQMRARMLLARWCSPQTMERIVDPVLADTEHEHRHLLAQRRPWRARWLSLVGTWALIRAVAAQATYAVAAYEPDVTRQPRQAVLVGLAVLAASTAMLATLPFLEAFARHAGSDLMLAMYLLPQALPAGLIAGLVAATLWLGSQARASRRALTGVWLAAAATVMLTGLLLAWAIPAANHAFLRELFPATAAVPRGLNELTLIELWAVATGSPGPADLMATSGPAALLALHGRAALTLAPLVLTFTALSFASLVRGAAARMAGGAAGVTAYVAWWFGVALAAAPEHHVLIAAWTPSVAALLAGMLARRRGGAVAL